MDIKIQCIIKRFARAFVAGAVATMIVVVPVANSWSELSTWLYALALAGVVGGISGIIQAADKYYRFEEWWVYNVASCYYYSNLGYMW